MALPFFKKKEEDVPMQEGSVPVASVLNMRGQGMSNNNIANQLRAQGYSLEKIRDAISQADIKGAVSSEGSFPQQQGFPQQQSGFPQQQGPPQQQVPGQQPFPQQNFPQTPSDEGGFPEVPEMPPGFGEEQPSGFPELPPIGEFPGGELEAPLPPSPQPDFQSGSFQQPSQPHQGTFGPMPSIEGVDSSKLINELQRIVESIIEEKWNDVENDLNRLESWRVQTEDKVNEIEKKLNEGASRIDEFTKVVLEKSEDYKDAATGLKVQMEAIDKMMGKLVPSLGSEIKELREIVSKMKK